jgi:hypothetical protein
MRVSANFGAAAGLLEVEIAATASGAELKAALGLSSQDRVFFPSPSRTLLKMGSTLEEQQIPDGCTMTVFKAVSSEQRGLQRSTRRARRTPGAAVRLEAAVMEEGLACRKAIEDVGGAVSFLVGERMVKEATVAKRKATLAAKKAGSAASPATAAPGGSSAVPAVPAASTGGGVEPEATEEEVAFGCGGSGGCGDCGGGSWWWQASLAAVVVVVVWWRPSCEAARLKRNAAQKRRRETKKEAAKRPAGAAGAVATAPVPADVLELEDAADTLLVQAGRRLRSWFGSRGCVGFPLCFPLPSCCCPRGAA